MGQKIATEEDYWMCTQGIMPARMQSVQLTVKQKDGKKYLLKTDTATASVGDFVCKWMMLIMAAIAAIVTVAIVATGGAALGAIVVAGAIAGAAGAAVGSIAGALVCGQKAALIRTWTVEKNNLVIGGQKTLTTGSVMKCPIFGAEIRQAPNVKNWWQALLVGVGNFGTTVVEGALGGALIGTIGALFAGAATIAVPTLGSIWANIAGSFTGIGLAVRGVFGANQASNDWATGRANTASDAAQSFGEGAIPEAGSIKRIATGQAQPTDALLLLYFLHLKTPVKEPQPKEEPAKEDEGKTKDEPDAQAPKPANEPEAVKPGEDGKAYEEGNLEGKISESQTARDRAIDEYNQLGKNFESKTVATDGIKAVSGWKESPGGYTDVPPKKVKSYSDEIGHSPKKAGAMDQIKQGGFDGKYNSSHAEKKVLVNSPNEPVGVSRPMCVDCQSFAQKQAIATGKEVIVSDPEGTRIFNPDGTVEFIPK
ncbi:hypothetical protein [Mucilaginibacter sp. KACC 22063]|uniref:hypothetical protein n=1 Tax=Mucilaginibacter sp. KACC 22063 TaxID=3025666 RepID=UPI002366B6BF|nr:hypothetical protein [Mucilaginibacter sp. KACC 22063]WDF54386.1 hypothetical protein PQ461_15695 [Mucilaginibacter sp. KACC 22063]